MIRGVAQPNCARSGNMRVDARAVDAQSGVLMQFPQTFQLYGLLDTLVSCSKRLWSGMSANTAKAALVCRRTFLSGWRGCAARSSKPTRPAVRHDKPLIEPRVRFILPPPPPARSAPVTCGRRPHKIPLTFCIMLSCHRQSVCCRYAILFARAAAAIFVGRSSIRRSLRSVVKRTLPIKCLPSAPQLRDRVRRLLEYCSKLGEEPMLARF
jgi:hypothetical protein